MPWFKICHQDEINQCNSKTFSIDVFDSYLEIVLVFHQSQWQAFVNRCPHTGVKLDWGNDSVWSYDNQYLICSTHGALFQPDSGRCVWGPCLNQSLEKLPLRQDNCQVFVKVLPSCPWLKQKNR